MTVRVKPLVRAYIISQAKSYDHVPAPYVERRDMTMTMTFDGVTYTHAVVDPGGDVVGVARDVARY